ncbi:hypothetical protein [Vibrio phage P23]|nr:hypothetical protein [Vibrio phage P23]
MNKSELILIKDNPNLSSSALARLIGVDRSRVSRARKKPLWSHSGVGIPYTCRKVTSSVYLQLMCKGRSIASGKLNHILENLDRLIFCLENNNGELPKTTNDAVFGGLRFIKDE